MHTYIFYIYTYITFTLNSKWPFPSPTCNKKQHGIQKTPAQTATSDERAPHLACYDTPSPCIVPLPQAPPAHRAGAALARDRRKTRGGSTKHPNATIYKWTFRKTGLHPCALSEFGGSWTNGISFLPVYRPLTLFDAKTNRGSMSDTHGGWYAFHLKFRSVYIYICSDVYTTLYELQDGFSCLHRIQMDALMPWTINTLKTLVMRADRNSYMYMYIYVKNIHKHI